jgi:hypothetical protein
VMGTLIFVVALIGIGGWVLLQRRAEGRALVATEADL